MRTKSGKGEKTTAKKRMFSLGVLETDAFLDMPLSAQALYFHLNLRADDDGFIGNPKRITQNIGANLDDLKLLVAKRFVIAFEDGVIVIKHWRMHNAIKRDRYTETNFTDDLRLLDIKDNGAYTLKSGEQLENKWSANGAQMSQTYSADKNKDRLVEDKVKVREGEDIQEETDTNVSVKKKFTPPTVEEVSDYCFEQNLGIDPEAFVDYYNANGWMIGGKAHMKDWRAAARNWDRKRKADKSNPNSRYLTKGEQAKKDMDDFYQMTREWVEESTNDASGIR